MSMKIVRTSLASVATVFALAFAGFANGALFGSHYDPLAFIGDALFQFDDGACLTDGTHIGTDCNAQLLSATFDMSDGVPVDGTAHFDFASVLPSILINDFVISGGVLVGVNTAPIGPDFAQTCPFVGCTGPWWIQWIYTPADPENHLLASNTVALYTGECNYDYIDSNVGLHTKSAAPDSFDPCSRNQQTSAVANEVTFSRVPEPGTILLVAAGLLAAGVMRRRSTSQRDS